MPRDPAKVYPTKTLHTFQGALNAEELNGQVEKMLANYEHKSLNGITVFPVLRDEFLARVPSAVNRFEQVRNQDNSVLVVLPARGMEGPKQYVWTCWEDRPISGQIPVVTTYVYDNILNLSATIPGDIRLGDTVIYRSMSTARPQHPNELEDLVNRLAGFLTHKRNEWFDKTAVIRNLASTHTTL